MKKKKKNSEERHAMKASCMYHRALSACAPREDIIIWRLKERGGEGLKKAISRIAAPRQLTARGINALYCARGIISPNDVVKQQRKRHHLHQRAAN